MSQIPSDIQRDDAGRPDPLHDFRFVPAHVLGRYMECDEDTVLAMAHDGRFPAAAVQERGQVRPRRYFCPALVYGAQVPA